MTSPIRVLIVDDSALIRQMLCELLAAEPGIDVVGAAEDPYDAREKIKKLNPDVLTLDVEMPHMDGISFLEKIMALRPMPVVMVSTLTGKGMETAIAALQIGAVECIAKPLAQSPEALEAFSRELCAKIRIAASARLQGRRSGNAVRSPGPEKPAPGAPSLIAIGASTGGVEALTELLTRLPRNCPPIVITQHMPPLFTASFAQRLCGLCAFKVLEGADRAPIAPGTAVIAPGGFQMEVIRSGRQFFCKVTDAPPVSSHKPSVDVLFRSIAGCAGREALGVILTGMGKDGAKGLLSMRNEGAHTIGQDESSCVVYGMPRAAFEAGAVAEVLPLSLIPETIRKRCFA